MKNIVPVILLLAFVLSHSCENEVYQWRGALRDGVYQETGLLNEWPEDGPELLWVSKGLGRGYAAPVLTDDQIFVNGEQEGNSFLFAFDLDGNLLWKSPNGKEFVGEGFSSTYPGARSTPSVVGKWVYTTAGRGNIACFNKSTGKEKWSLNIVDDLGGEVAYFGYSESVAVDNDNVYCFPGGQDANMAALDRLTGQTVWTSELERDTFAYGSPVLVDLPSRKILIHTSRYSIFTVDCESGELLATYKLEGYEYDGEHCNTPVYNNGHIYFVANDVESQGAMKLKLSDDGEQIKEVWRHKGILNNFGGLLVVDDHLFTTVKGNWLLSLEPESGAISDSIKVATGSLAFADNKIICYGNNGEINLITKGEGKPEVSGKLKINEGSGHHFSYPVVAGGIMYIRRGDALMAYQVK